MGSYQIDTDQYREKQRLLEPQDFHNQLLTTNSHVTCLLKLCQLSK